MYGDQRKLDSRQCFKPSESDEKQLTLPLDIQDWGIRQNVNELFGEEMIYQICSQNWLILQMCNVN